MRKLGALLVMALTAVAVLVLFSPRDPNDTGRALYKEAIALWADDNHSGCLAKCEQSENALASLADEEVDHDLMLAVRWLKVDCYRQLNDKLNERAALQRLETLLQKMISNCPGGRTYQADLQQVRKSLSGIK